MQSNGRKTTTRHLVVLWRENEGEPARFGLAVSGRVGNAVVRNRVKRWLRESIRHERAGLTGVDVVLIARPSAAEAGYAVLRQEISTALQRTRGAPR